MKKICVLFAVSILAVGVISCGGDSAAPPGGGGGGGGGGDSNCPAGVFCMGSSIFTTTASIAQPVSLTVATNTAVTWTNNSGGTEHDVVFDAPTAALAVGAGGAGNIPLHTSGSNQRQFAAAGTYAFHCTVHGTATSGMRGRVIVQ
ncbi:MAG: plastocyanin/azurin family copper-binding protein [Gemmatimonadaceae bacterium]